MRKEDPTQEPLGAGPAKRRLVKKRFGLRMHYQGFFGPSQWTTWYATEKAREDAEACKGGIGGWLKPTKIERIER